MQRGVTTDPGGWGVPQVWRVGGREGFTLAMSHRRLYVRVTPLMSRRKGDAAERAIVELEDRHLSLDRLYPPMVCLWVRRVTSLARLE